MQTEKLKELIAKSKEIDSKLAEINADENRFQAERKKLIDSGDYSGDAVAGVSRLDTQLAMVPSARNRTLAGIDSLKRSLYAEIKACAQEMQQQCIIIADQKHSEAMEALAPFCDPKSGKASKLADQTDAVISARSDVSAIGSIAAEHNVDTTGIDEIVSSAEYMLLCAERLEQGKSVSS